MKTFIALALLTTIAHAQTAPRPVQTPPPAQADARRPAPQVVTAPRSGSSPTVVTQVLQRGGAASTTLGRSGTGIGGGVVYEGLLSWCDQAAGILHDAQIEAREAWGLSGDSIEALGLYRDGLVNAAGSADQTQTQGQTFTLRYVQRGLVLSQILGIDDVLDGRAQINHQTSELVSFIDWYVGFTANVGERLDRPHYLPYLARGIRTAELEERSVALSVSALRELDRKFVRTLPDQSNMYTTIAVPQYLSALAYMLPQVAGDLRESLFSDSYVCQARRMDQLSQQIQRYLSNRNGNSQDAIRLNRFSLSVRDILQKIEADNCY
jgi:hypothetical protein